MKNKLKKKKKISDDKFSFLEKIFKRTKPVLIVTLRHPLFLLLVSLALGSGLFQKISEERAKADARRQLSIAFINEIANEINPPLSRLYGQIRSENDFPLNDLNSQSGKLFTKRTSVNIRAMAYLQDYNFSEKYDSIVFSISDLVDSLWDAKKNVQTLDREAIKSSISKYSKKWSIEVDYSQDEGLPSPYGLYIVWLDLIWDYSNTLLTDALQKILR
ncbi:hypothetical protein HGB47_20760 [Leptospira yasudae]|uniref:hypothetical protein n=1 Tax=Leptospira yasudae TaxID=2202201 RepID=UPI001C4F3F60|nr:hypothetical protein [Leptospira yasudae]MBW0436042.1 hypothetical protein [Leptospira yasudae]